MEEFIIASWIFIPTVLANPAPVIANNIKYIKEYNYPMDFYKEYKGKRILGSHKTIRGLISGIIGGGIAGLIQLIIASNFQYFAGITSSLDYTSPYIILFGMLLGLGAMLGDSAKSFFKRQINIAPGHSWFPFDQLDFVIGAIAFSLFVVRLDFSIYLVAILLALILHPLFNIASWLMGLQSKPY